MKNFRTVVAPDKASFQINHAHKLVSIGSCFSENIGKKFQEYKFDININPFGQQYNPASIATAINRLLEPVPYTEKDLVYHDELFHSFDHHGSFSRSTEKETLEVINSNLEIASKALKEADVLFLTFGTAHAFSLLSNQKTVSNCHKLSGNQFERFMLSPGDISRVMTESISNLRKINPEVRILATISPVRYFAFGHYENSVSKAHLFTALHGLIEDFKLDYFPAYELVMDDLRDYRFFAEDMLHPNYQATNYVWDSFAKTYFDKKTTETNKDIEEITAAARHRPRNAKSEAHKKFVAKYLSKIEELKGSGLDFGEEEKVLRR